MNTTLPEPKMGLVQTKIEEFNSENENLERGLTQLIQAFPKNSDLGHALVKVAAINTLYSTNIRGQVKIYAVANLIKSRDIDPLLESGSAKAVNAIERVEYRGRSERIYSFATKYCSWHQPTRYPIYDSRVDFCLRAYRDLYKFQEFDYYSLLDYEKLREVVDAFRKRFQLESLSYKEVDKFLYQLGSDYFLPSESASTKADIGQVPPVIREAVLEVGSEGGSITLWRENVGKGWQYRTGTDEKAAYEMLSAEDRAGIEFQKTSPGVESLEEALEHLDRYPWTRMVPLRVHPEYLQQILAAVERRDGSETAGRWSKFVPR